MPGAAGTVKLQNVQEIFGVSKKLCLSFAEHVGIKHVGCTISPRMSDLAIYSITSFSARQRAHIVRPYRWHTITIPSASLKTHLPLHIKMVPHPIRGHGTISFYPTLCDVSSCSVLFVPAHQYAKHYRQHKIDHCHHHKAAKQTAHISNQQVFQGRRVNAQAC